MEITKYLCEFFFTNFWHWLGLLFIVYSLGRIKIEKYNKKEEEE